MLGKLFRNKTKKLRVSICKIIRYTGISPNLLTFLSLILSLIAFWAILTKNYIFAVLFVIISSGVDSLDGTLALLINKKTLLGNYLDVMVDRYRELIFYCGFAISGFYLEAFFAATGSMIISYAKARTAITIPIENNDWPAMGEMFDRLSLLIMGMIVSIFLPRLLNFSTMSLTLWLVALVTHIGAIQRIFYAKDLIKRYESEYIGMPTEKGMCAKEQ